MYVSQDADPATAKFTGIAHSPWRRAGEKKAQVFNVVEPT